jgi:LysM repeat protein
MSERMIEPFQSYEPEADSGYDWDYEPEDHRPRPKILWGRLISLAAFVLIAFFVGRMTVDEGIPQETVDQLRTDLAVAEEQADAAEAQSEQFRAQRDAARNEIREINEGAVDPEGEQPPATEGGKSKLYVVKSGDTLTEISKRFYGTTEHADYIADANNLDASAGLVIGDELVIPPKPSE